MPMKFAQKKQAVSDDEDDFLQESFLQECIQEWNELGQAPIFEKNEPLPKYPTFGRNEIVLGKALGEGTIGMVREVVCIRSDDNEDIQLPLKTGIQKSSSNGTFLMDDSSHGHDYNTKEGEVETSINPGMAKYNGKIGRYAVKYLRDDLKRSPTSFQTIRARLALAMEAKYLQALQHPCIISIRGVPRKTENDFMEPDYFFLMDRLESTLDERMELWRAELMRKGGRRCLGLVRKSDKDIQTKTFQERLQVAQDIASACAHMHSHKLIHRDLKPKNIGFDYHGQTKVLDLTLAKPLLPQDHVRSGLYHLTARTGTWRYMAPEVAKRGEPYNEKCDVHSLAITLWEMMTLQRAFGKYRNRKIFYGKVVVAGVRPSLGNHHDWPLEMKPLLSRCWDPLLLERPSMDCICNTLQQIRNDLLEE